MPCFFIWFLPWLSKNKSLFDERKAISEYCSCPQFAYVSHPLCQRSPPAHCSTDDEDAGARSPPFEVSEGEEDHEAHLASTSTSITGERKTEGLKRQGPFHIWFAVNLFISYNLKKDIVGLKDTGHCFTKPLWSCYCVSMKRALLHNST